MCGICGIVQFDSQPASEVVERMTETLAHRGPDMGGTCSFPGCVLGHRRLSIVDLSEVAGQPMISSDGGTALVFNGEIYNFPEIRKRLENRGRRFRTRSDTEVLLKLYLDKGEAMLSDLNGMFSFAVWDSRRGRLFMARDRLGKKPLYYYRHGERLGFSSEVFSLLQDPAAPRRISEQALFEYLLYDFVPAPHTIFRDAFKLPAAHAAIFDSEGLRIWQYWQPPAPEAAGDYRSSLSRLGELLEDAVRVRLISDVPLGAFLSGGIDSSLITAIMKQGCTEDVRTFSISFPGTTHDESAWSGLVSRSLGTVHREYPVEYGVEKLLPTMVRHFGEPFGDSSAIPTWHLSQQTRQDVTVALSGDGGDELFGGYDRYVARRLQAAYDLVPRSLRERLIEPLIERLPATTDYYGTSITKKLKLFAEASRRMRREPLALIPRTFSVDQVRSLTGIEYQPDLDPVLEITRCCPGSDAVSRMQLADLQTYLAEDILTKVDRMSMAHALEVRSPLLDYRVVEFACALPRSFKIRGARTKRILKDLARGRVPDSVIRRSKYGFQVPLGAWFRGGLKTWAEERLMEAEHRFFHREFVEKLWSDHQQGRADHVHRIWLLIFFNEWSAQFLG